MVNPQMPQYLTQDRHPIVSATFSPGLWRENRLRAEKRSLLRLPVCIKAESSRWPPPDGNPTCERIRLAEATDPIPALRFHHRSSQQIFVLLDSPWNQSSAFKYRPSSTNPLTSSFPHQLPNMCPPTEETPATNGHTNGTNGANGSKEGFTGVTTRQNPHPTHKSPYAPVGDFLSNVGRFKIIGTS